MRAVDTNVLVRLIAQDDADQVSAARRFIEGGVWVSVLVLAEAVWVLNRIYKFDAGQQAVALEMLLQNRQLLIQDSEAIQGALDLFRNHPVLGFADCLALQLAKDAGHLPLGTFDRKLAKLTGVQRI
jgi:predicted nucleic-acid-binding protein